MDERSGDGRRPLRSSLRGSKSWLLIAALIAAMFYIGYQQNHDSGNDPQPSSPSVAATASGHFTVGDLPKEARETLALIDHGGPYPYRQDNTVFGNRERRLPIKPSGYYHEFTVTTPGSDDRGARRLIRGRDGETYYTSDHYASFHLVERN